MKAWFLRWGALAIVLMLAAFLRLDGIRWDDGIYPHPDERYMTMLSAAVHSNKIALTDTDDGRRAVHQALCEQRYPASNGVGPWLDTECADFNPENIGYARYPYGQLPLTIVRLAAELSQKISGWNGFVQYGGIHLVGRAFSAVADLLTLLALFLLGRLAWNRRVGILAAALYAVAVLPIQLSHFWTVDTSANLFATVALIFLVRLARFGERADALAFGAAYGLTLASKISLLPLLACFPLALYLAPHQHEVQRLSRIRGYAITTLLCSLGAWLTFRIASPYAFSSALWSEFGLRPEFIAQLLESRRLASGVVDIPPNWQWLGRPAWLWPGKNLIVWGLGLPLGLAAIIASLHIGWRLRRATPVQHGRAIIWLWCVGYFFWMGQQWVATMRYFLPIYPLLCLLVAAWLLPWLRAQKHQKRPSTWHDRLRAKWPRVVLTSVLLASLAWALAFHSVHRTLHPYLAGTHWVLRNLPGPISASISTHQGETILINWPARGEHGDGIPPRVAAATLAPTSGEIKTLNLLHVRIKSDTGAPILVARILSAEGKLLATTPAQRIAPTDAEISTELQLDKPLQLRGGELYQLQIEASGGVVTLEGTRIANEGAWNDVVPTRSPWLPVTDGDELTGKSGTVPRDTQRVDPYGEGYYTSIDLGMTGEDDEAKRLRLISGLDRAEWLIIPNNRFYDSMSRNPLRYPLSSRFYDELFAGSLGFSRERFVSSQPGLAGLTIPDQAIPKQGHGVTNRTGLAWAAEEAFSVYDHPVAFIFRKTSEYSSQNVQRALSGLELRDVQSALQEPKPSLAGRLTWSTRDASYAPTGLLRDDKSVRNPPDPADSTPAVTARPLSTALLVVVWYLLAMLLGLMAKPILQRTWSDLTDGGYGVARIAGLIMLVAPAWWLLWIGVPIWSTKGLWALLVPLLALSAGLYWKRKSVLLSSENFWRSHFLRIEAIFLAMFALGLWLRFINPDLWAPAFGGEKPMDFAYFNSVLLADTLPPADPWFSGGRMNYYYFGWTLVGGLTKLSNAPPALAYNLALATWFAMTAVGAFSLAWNLWTHAEQTSRSQHKAWIAGLIALFATVLLGNLDLPRALAPNIKAAQAVLKAETAVPGALHNALTERSERWLWAPSRTVGERPGSSQEINEFPAFTFLYGDLHPHFMALPLQILILVSLSGMLLWRETSALAQAPPSGHMLVAQVVIAAIGLAALRACNSWDWPAYLGLATLACLIATRVQLGDMRNSSTPAWIRTTAMILLLIALQALFALPFSNYFVTGPIQLHLFGGKATALSAWLAIQGWFVVAIATWAWRLAQLTPVGSPLPPCMSRMLGGILRITLLSGLIYTLFMAVIAFYTAEGEVPAVGLQLALLAWIADLLRRHAGERRRALALALALAGFGLAFLVEFVVIGADIGRMNTFFKFYLQSWVLLSPAAGLALADLYGTGLPRLERRLFIPLFATTSLIALAYLPFAIYGRAHTRFDPAAAPSLDGEAFLASAVYEIEGQKIRLADDYRLIRWLREHTAPNDTLLEAQLPEYRWGGRISVFTGHPTVLGYRHHQSQQRPLSALGEAIELRKQNVKAIYESEDASVAFKALQHYDVRYIIIGGTERAVYPASGLAKFASLAAQGKLEPVFLSGDDVIYRVVDPKALHPAYGAHW